MSNSHLDKIDKIAAKIGASSLTKPAATEFNIFTTETGEKVSTEERVCKGNRILNS